MFARRSILALALVAAAVAAAAPRPSSGAGPEERYVVRAGDTLWALAAERYPGDPRAGVWEIRRRNGLARSSLVAGVVLYLPARGGGSEGTTET